jgi:hypothetical protein
MKGKNAILLVYLISKSINEYVGIFRLLHKKLKVRWKKSNKTNRACSFIREFKLAGLSTLRIKSLWSCIQISFNPTIEPLAIELDEFEVGKYSVHRQ